MQLSVIQEKIHYSQKIIEFKYHIKKRWVTHFLLAIFWEIINERHFFSNQALFEKKKKMDT